MADAPSAPPPVRESSRSAVPPNPDPMLTLPEEELPHPCADIADMCREYVTSAKELVQETRKIPPFMLSSARFYWTHPLTCIVEILSGMSLSVVLVAEAIAFSVVAGMPPLSGLYACFITGIIAGTFTLRPPLLTGAAGAMAFAVADLTSDSGPLSTLSLADRRTHLVMSIFICGCMQLLIGGLGLVRYVRLIPRATMIGFLNGLAIIIFLSQLPAFKYCSDTSVAHFEECPSSAKHYLSPRSLGTWLAVINCLLAFGIVNLFPRVPKLGRIVPATLVALLIGTAFEHAIARAAADSPTRTVGESAPVSGGLPSLSWPGIPASWSSWGPVLQYAFFAAAVGLIESLLTAQALAEVIDEPLPAAAPGREALAQGFGNIVTGLCGGMGGNAMIGETLLIYNSGARGRLSVFVYGWCVLLIVLVLSVAVNAVPVATIAGIVVGIAFHTFHWPSLLILHRVRRSDALAIIGVTLAAVFLSLIYAVAIGVVFAALVAAVDASKGLTVTRKGDATEAEWARARAKLEAGYTGGLEGALWVGGEERGGGRAWNCDVDHDSDYEPVGADDDIEDGAKEGRGASPTEIEMGLMLCPSSSAASTSAALTGIPADGGLAGARGAVDEEGVPMMSPLPSETPLDGPSSPLTSPRPVLASIAEATDNEDTPRVASATRPAVGIYSIDGTLFFASSYLLPARILPSRAPPTVVLDLAECSVADLSGAAELARLLGRISRAGKGAAVVGLGRKTKRQLLRTREFRLLTRERLGQHGYWFPPEEGHSAEAGAGHSTEAGGARVAPGEGVERGAGEEEEEGGGAGADGLPAMTATAPAVVTSVSVSHVARSPSISGSTPSSPAAATATDGGVHVGSSVAPAKLNSTVETGDDDDDDDDGLELRLAQGQGQGENEGDSLLTGPGAHAGGMLYDDDDDDGVERFGDQDGGMEGLEDEEEEEGAESHHKPAEAWGSEPDE